MAASVTAVSSSAMRNKFHKTRVCSFFLVGKCRKRGACNFAHSEQEISDLPDLSRTKMCPAALQDRPCADFACSFAHRSGELRVDPRRGAGAGPGPTADQPQAQVQEQPSKLVLLLQEALDLTPVNSKRGRSSKDGLSGYPLPRTPSLRVKNTFIDVEDLSWEVPSRRKRADTMPHSYCLQLCPSLLAAAGYSEPLCRFSHERAPEPLPPHFGASEDAGDEAEAEVDTKDMPLAPEWSLSLPLGGIENRNDGGHIMLQEPRGAQFPLRRKTPVVEEELMPSIEQEEAPGSWKKVAPFASDTSAGVDDGASSVCSSEESEILVGKRVADAASDGVLESEQGDAAGAHVTDDDDDSDDDDDNLGTPVRRCRSMPELRNCHTVTFTDIEDALSPVSPMGLPQKSKSTGF